MSQKEKGYSLAQNSFWMELTVLETVQEMLGSKLGGQKG